MTPLQALQHHQQLCDELHELALEENRFLLQHQRAPDATLQEKKKHLLSRLDQSLATLRTTPRTGESNQPALRQALDKARARILQVLQLDKENEQLLLRCSLAAGRGAQGPNTVPPSMLQKIYQRHG